MLCFSYPSFLPVNKMESGTGFKTYHHSLKNTILTGLTESFPKLIILLFTSLNKLLLFWGGKKGPPKNPSIFILNQICPLLFNLQGQTNIILTDNSNLLCISFYSSKPILLLFLSSELSFQSLHLYCSLIIQSTLILNSSYYSLLLLLLIFKTSNTFNLFIHYCFSTIDS